MKACMFLVPPFTPHYIIMVKGLLCRCMISSFCQKGRTAKHHSSLSLSLTHTHTQDGPSRSAIYLLSSYLPKKAVSDILKGTLQSLASLSYPTNSQDYTSILVALVAWQQASQVIKLTNQWLESELSVKSATQLQPIPVNAKVNKRNKTRKVGSYMYGLYVSTSDF